MTEEGHDAITIHARTSNGYSDAVLHRYQVLESHRRIDAAVFYDNVSPGTSFDINPGGLTDITFTDRGRGQYLSDLMSLRHIWRSGPRIEALVSRREAARLIQTHFPDVGMFGDAGAFDAADYQTEAGGIAILPYAYADLHATVLLIPFIKDEVNRVTLARYLRGNLNGGLDDRVLALYGLALLNEPVLLDMQRYAARTDLSVRNSAYVALSLAAIGETHAARRVYLDSIAPHIQAIAPYFRVNAGTNRREILDATSVVALLAARLGMPEAAGLYEYTVANRFDTFNRNDPFSSRTAAVHLTPDNEPYRRTRGHNL
jgi:hypothetical protein